MKKTKKSKIIEESIKPRIISGVVLFAGFILVVYLASQGFLELEPPMQNPESEQNPKSGTQNQEPEFETVDLTHLRLEIVDTDEARKQGLSGRESLDEDAGMLFTYDLSWYHSFWMKDMNFHLDIIWMNDGIVVDVATLRPPSSSLPLPDSHVPKAKANRVLEINAGQAAELGLKPGVRVILPAY
ncbi:MAG: DUF192 domain-containing protein [Patescibacteria group bacterium]|nr:DUF192 domain-containing protein [Patescibacteria group bacterium]MBU2508917.1 DUF192 domain-containing protein [Patescibacteria group bacterium]